ncbi:MAG: hypothetical protein A2169_06000 [Deltaproteobacteria bacterium RBG_13_47_9]|nr:MAG: hypothetical protein A2169_06000 [Deltaproteobacteria bacterium RBG_13_47_9]
MGTGCRVFLIDDNDSLHRMPIARLERLLHSDRRESLPHFGGKRVRFARVFLETAGRQVLAITHSDYFMLSFDVKGRINKKEWERGMRLGLELLPPLINDQHPKQIVDSRHRFAKRRYEHEFKWKPTRKIEGAIVADIFRSKVAKL